MKATTSKGTDRQVLVPSTPRMKFTPFDEKMSIKKDIFDNEIYKSVALCARSFKRKVTFSS